MHNPKDAYCQACTKIDSTKNVHLKIEPVFSPNTFYIPFFVDGYCLLCTGQLIFGNGAQGLEKWFCFFCNCSSKAPYKALEAGEYFNAKRTNVLISLSEIFLMMAKIRLQDASIPASGIFLM